MKKILLTLLKSIKGIFIDRKVSYQINSEKKIFTLLLIEADGTRTIVPISKETSRDLILLYEFARRLLDTNKNMKLVINIDYIANADVSITAK